MEIRATSFLNRGDLDIFVQNLSEKDGASIVGTREELAALQLSEKTTVWGVPCKIISGDNK